MNLLLLTLVFSQDELSGQDDANQWFEPNMYVWDKMLKKGQPYSWVEKKNTTKVP